MKYLQPTYSLLRAFNSLLDMHCARFERTVLKLELSSTSSQWSGYRRRNRQVEKAEKLDGREKIDYAAT